MALNFREVAILQHGPVLSLTIEPGQSLCVVGPADSGKSKLLRIVSGREIPDRGVIDRPSSVSVPEACNRKLRPQDLSHKRGANNAALATEVLSQLRLWDVRQKPISELTPPQTTACDLVETFMGSTDLIVLDEHLDRLDPWTRADALHLIRDRGRQGTIMVAATNQIDLASQFDFLIVLKDHQQVYSGRVADLIASRGQRSLTIESERTMGVRALVEPLLVGVARTDTGFKLTPGPGQEHTAKLLRDGYGDVKYVVSDQKSLQEIILGMIS